MGHPKTDELRKRKAAALAGGGAERSAAQKAKGKLLARERIDLLVDEGSFHEVDLLAEPRSRAFGLEGRAIPADGVVAGIAKIAGRKVVVFSQDFTVLGGSLGLGHALKICKVLDLASANGCPVVALCDSGGARIQEGVESLGGYAEIFWRNVQLSGKVPQISAILGPCAGGAVYSPAMTDFIFMVRGTSHMFITGPDVVKAATGETTDFDTLGGADIHAKKSGVCHFVANSEQDCFRQIRELLSYLPSHCFDATPAGTDKDPAARESDLLERLSEADPKRPYDVRDVVTELADGKAFLEVHKEFAPNIVCGFMRLGGRVVGCVANNPKHLSGALDISASQKGGRFVRFCDAFNIPILTLVDVPGYWPGTEQEHGGVIRHGAKLLYSYCQSTVPKVTLVLRKAYGGAYDVMASKHVRGDFNFAWPCAEIAVMGPQGAVEILYAREIAKAPDPKAHEDKLIADYVQQFSNPYLAAARGYVDDVIEARHSRAKLIAAFEFLKDKKVEPPKKRHGNIPL